MQFRCINVFRDKIRGRYVEPGEVVQINSEEEAQRLTLANCIRPMPEGPRKSPLAPPQCEAPQGPVTEPAVETASVEVPERQAHTGRRRGRRKKE